MAAQVAHAAVTLALHAMKKDKRMFRNWIDQGKVSLVLHIILDTTQRVMGNSYIF